jgi:RNA polymerase sigma-70 factor, ECF subfamily
VLSLRALEIADMLDMSGSAVHSMLRRARTQVVAEHADDASAVPARSEAAILREYATAFETGDLAALKSLLTDDVCCDMGGPDGRDSGRHNVLRQLAGCPGVGSSRLVPVRVNGRPGFGAYRPDASGIWRAFCIDVLTVSPSGVERIEVLEDRALFATFGLPLTYDGVVAA